MILDAENTFSEEQAITVDAISENVIDLGANPTLRDMGNGDNAFLVVLVTEEFDSAADAGTLQVKLLSDSTANLTTSPTTHLDTGLLAQGVLLAGAKLFAIRLPVERTYERYLGLDFDNETAAFTAGKITAFLARDLQAWTAYPGETGS